MRIIWVRHAKQMGLAAVGAAPRGWYIKCTKDGVSDLIASVAAVGGGAFRGMFKGWTFSVYARKELGLTAFNSQDVFEDVEVAKIQCMDKVTRQLNGR